MTARRLVASSAMLLATVLARPVAAQEMSAAAIEADTRLLADDLLEGREAGTRGYDLAAAIVAARFAALGLTPAGDAAGWYQPVRLRRRTLEAADMTIETPRGRIALVNGRDAAIDGSITATRDAVDAPLVFVGWGISAPALGHDDYAGRDVRGKAVVLFEGAPLTMPGALRAHYGWTDQKAAMAIARGAAAVIAIKTPTREAVSPWERARVGRPQPGLSWIGRDGTADRRFAVPTVTLGPQAALRLFADAGAELATIAAAADWDEPTQADLVGRFRLRRETSHQHVESSNVLALLPGRDPRLRDEVVVVTAHLDHVGIGPPVNGDAIYNGAADNAVGIAEMLEIARILSSGRRPRRSVLFLATTAEEKGLLGSSYFVEYPTVPLSRVAAVVNMDGLPGFFDFADVVALGADHSTLASVSRAAAAAIDAKEVPDPIPERGNLALSDQYPFLRRGIPVLFPLPGRGRARDGGDGAAAWDAFMKNRYHQPSDDLNQPWRWDVAARWGRYLLELVRGTADLPSRPRWRHGNPLAAAFAPPEGAAGEAKAPK